MVVIVKNVWLIYPQAALSEKIDTKNGPKMIEGKFEINEPVHYKYYY